MSEDLEHKVALAGEYALGLLEGQEKQEFEAQLANDAELRQLLASWTGHFARLSEKLPRKEVPAHVWTDISRHIYQERKQQSSSSCAQSNSLWKGLALAASVAAVALGVSLYQVQVEQSSDRFMAVMKSPDGKSEWLVEARANQKVAVYQIGQLPDNAQDAQDKSLQLWTKPPGAKGPTSLGFVELGKPLVLPAEMLPALVDNQLFEVTLEPKAGSPYGDRPSGPIMFVGKAVALNN